MTDFFFKNKGEHTDDLRRTKQWKNFASGGSSDPTKTMEFESEGHRRDYERQVNANRLNVLGMPPFFPPEVLRATGIGDGEPCETLPCGHPWRKKSYNEKDGWTLTCRYDHSFDEKGQPR